jgi:hypothetical protein
VIGDFFDPDILSGEDRAQVDLASAEAQPRALRDCHGAVVEGSQPAKSIRDSGSGRSKSPNVRLQSDPVSLHELKVWTSGGVHVRPLPPDCF